MSTNIHPTVQQLWDTFDFKPNQAQRKAILHTSGPLYLPAGPGSGKSRTLLWRTVNLIIVEGVDPNAIFLSTFTEKAARNLREGMRSLLGAASNLTGYSYDVERMYIGTIHSLCQRIIGDRRFFPDFHVRRQPTLLDELGQYFTVYRQSQWNVLIDGLDFGPEPCETINGLFAERGKSRHVAASGVISLFNRLSEECLDNSHWEGKSFTPELDDCLLKLLKAYERYRAKLSDNPSNTDFSLLQQEALKVVSEYDGPSVFEHIIVDEYQDTNTVQERLLFNLANGTKNLCVVGDDDQALYRFRGATVENFVQFPSRCKHLLETHPTTIPLSTNYRSRIEIVNCYRRFMDWADWSQHGKSGGRDPKAAYPGDHFRVADKDIHANSTDNGPAVVATTPGNGEHVAVEIGRFCKKLIDDGVVDNPNQIAFLFPSLKSVQVGRMKRELESFGLKVYAPRAGTFLEVEEATAMFGLFLRVFGRPHLSFNAPDASDLAKYHRWMDQAWIVGGELIDCDRSLGEFVKDRKADITRVLSDYKILHGVVTAKKWDEDAPYDLATMRRPLATASGLSIEAQRTLTSNYFDFAIEKRTREGQPFALKYIINRATSLDWNPLDLFYRLCGFEHFKAMFDLAEDGTDEGPICNLGLISQYLARFMDLYSSILTARLFDEDNFKHLLFSSYLYVLFRRGESEYEDAEDPFPRGRIPFLTIHQSKGLEFPVVVLGNTSKIDRGAQKIEELVAPLTQRGGEPLERMGEFDIMRLFYVALSRAENLLVLPHMRGQGIRMYPAFRPVFDRISHQIPTFDTSQIPRAKADGGDTPKNYSYTSDYLLYDKCPRQYMVFRKYGFEPSRSQTMAFGSLVHRTIEDLHQYLMAHRKASSGGNNG